MNGHSNFIFLIARTWRAPMWPSSYERINKFFIWQCKECTIDTSTTWMNLTLNAVRKKLDKECVPSVILLMYSARTCRPICSSVVAWGRGGGTQGDLRVMECLSQCFMDKCLCQTDWIVYFKRVQFIMLCL